MTDKGRSSSRKEQDGVLTFWDHLDVLRSSIIRMVVARLTYCTNCSASCLQDSTRASGAMPSGLWEQPT